MGVGKRGQGAPHSLESGEADTLFCPPTLDIYTLISNLAPHFKIASYAYVLLLGPNIKNISPVLINLATPLMLNDIMNNHVINQDFVS